MKIERAFGTILKKHRKQASFSQEQLALLSNLDRTYISLLERGLRKPTLTTVFIISKTLKIPPHELVKEVEELQSDY